MIGLIFFIVIQLQPVLSSGQPEFRDYVYFKDQACKANMPFADFLKHAKKPSSSG